MEYYQHSGKMSPAGIPLTILFGLIVAFVLGVAYSFANANSPIVALNFLLAVGLGFFIGKAVSLGIRLGKIRNPLMSGMYGLAIGIVGVYFAWVADIWARAGLKVGLQAFEPEVLYRYIQFFYDNGFWAIGNDAKTPVTGIFLAAVWLGEAAVIIGMAAYSAYRTISWLPFCESCDCWTKVTPKVSQLVIPDDAQDMIPAGDLSFLEGLQRAAGNEPKYLQLDLASCPMCENTHLLSVHAVEQSANKKGEIKKKTKVLLKHLVLSAADVTRIRSAGVVKPVEEAATQPQAQ